MKNIGIHFLILHLLFVFIFVSCKKDDDVKTKKNAINYDGESYSLSQGFLIYGGVVNFSPTSYNHTLILTSSDIEFDFDSETASGIGSGIIVDIYSSSSTEVEVGTYDFDDSYSGETNTFAWGLVLLDYDWSINLKSTDLEITSGTITVTKSESDYEISINCTTSEDTEFKAYYKGKLDYIAKRDQMEYNGISYDLSLGILAYYGQQNLSPASYAYELGLFSPGVTFDLETQSIGGFGTGLVFSIYSSSSTGLTSGEYFYEGTSSGAANSVDFGVVFENYDFTYSSGAVDFISDAEIYILKTGNEYEIEIYGGTNYAYFGSYYKGTLLYIDASETKNSGVPSTINYGKKFIPLHK